MVSLNIGRTSNKAKKKKKKKSPGELQRNNRDVTMVRDSVVSLRVFSQRYAVYCTERRGMEAFCLRFQLCQ